MGRVISVGLRRGHVCIQEALNLEPLFLRLSPRVQVPLTHSSFSSFSRTISPRIQSQAQVILSPGNLITLETLRFQVFGPKPPAQGTTGARLWDPGGGHVLLPVLPELCMLGTSFCSLTWASSLPVHALLHSLSQTQSLLLRTTGISPDTRHHGIASTAQ